MSNKILVPTDFSENAIYAARYACKLAQLKNLSIHLFHCYTTSSTQSASDPDDTPVFKADILIEELKNTLLKEFPFLQIDITCTTGLLAEALPKLAEDPSYKLVIMGTTGEGSGKPLLWGSNTSNITAKSPIPVIAIPNSNKDEFKLDKVAILSNFKPEELDSLKEYLSLVHHIAKLDIIHIYPESSEINKVDEKFDTWKFLIKEIDGIDHVDGIKRSIDYSSEETDTIPEVINKIIIQNNYDMIIVTKTRKSFFERLFSRSVSKEIALNLERPAFFDKT